MRLPTPPRPKLPPQPSPCGKCQACRHIVDEPCRRVQTWADDCDHVWSEHAEEREALLDEFARTGPRWEDGS